MELMVHPPGVTVSKSNSGSHAFPALVCRGGDTTCGAMWLPAESHHKAVSPQPSLYNQSGFCCSSCSPLHFPLTPLLVQGSKH